MNLEDLKLLARVQALGSFAAAARDLDVDPSAVSRTVAAVEAQLGTRLFERTTRVLRPTDAGARYLARIAPLLEDFDAAAAEAAEGTAQPSGHLRVTASTAFAHVCLLPLLPGFRADFPDITLELLPTDARLNLLADGVDLAIRLAPAPEGDVIATRLMRTSYRVVASPDWIATHGHPDTPQALSHHDVLRFALPQFRTAWTFRRHDTDAVEIPVQGGLVIGNALSLRAAARAGQGPALLADWLVDDDVKRGDLNDLFPGWQVTATNFETGAWALYPSRRYLPAKVRVMLDFLRSHLRR